MKDRAPLAHFVLNFANASLLAMQSHTASLPDDSLFSSSPGPVAAERSTPTPSRSETPTTSPDVPHFAGSPDLAAPEHAAASNSAAIPFRFIDQNGNPVQGLCAEAIPLSDSEWATLLGQGGKEYSGTDGVLYYDPSGREDPATELTLTIRSAWDHSLQKDYDIFISAAKDYAFELEYTDPNALLEKEIVIP